MRGFELALAGVNRRWGSRTLAEGSHAGVSRRRKSHLARRHLARNFSWAAGWKSELTELVPNLQSEAMGNRHRFPKDCDLTKMIVDAETAGCSCREESVVAPGKSALMAFLVGNPGLTREDENHFVFFVVPVESARSAFPEDNVGGTVFRRGERFITGTRLPTDYPVRIEGLVALLHLDGVDIVKHRGDFHRVSLGLE